MAGPRSAPDDGAIASIGPSLVPSGLAEPPHRGRGTHPSGANRTHATAIPTPSPTAHLAGHAGASRYVVFRPSLSPSAGRRETGRNLALDMVGAIGAGVSLALVVSLLPTIARRGGLDPIGLAALAAAPFIANLLGAFAGRVGPRSGRQLAAVRMSVRRRCCPCSCCPRRRSWWPPGSSSGSACRSPARSSSGCGAPCTRARLRGRIVGSLGMGRSAAMALASLGGGLIADAIGGPAVIALGGLVGAGLRHRVHRPACAGRRRTAAVLGARLAAVDPRTSRSWRASPWPRASTAAGWWPRSRCTPWSMSIGST